VVKEFGYDIYVTPPSPLSLSRMLTSILRYALGKMQDYYPELLAACYIVNVGWLFKFFWKILSSMVTGDTLKKVPLTLPL